MCAWRRHSLTCCNVRNCNLYAHTRLLFPLIAVSVRKAMSCCRRFSSRVRVYNTTTTHAYIYAYALRPGKFQGRGTSIRKREEEKKIAAIYKVRGAARLIVSHSAARLYFPSSLSLFISVFAPLQSSLEFRKCVIMPAIFPYQRRRCRCCCRCCRDLTTRLVNHARDFSTLGKLALKSWIDPYFGGTLLGYVCAWKCELLKILVSILTWKFRFLERLLSPNYYLRYCVSRTIHCK